MARSLSLGMLQSRFFSSGTHGEPWPSERAGYDLKLVGPGRCCPGFVLLCRSAAFDEDHSFRFLLHLLELGSRTVDKAFCIAGRGLLGWRRQGIRLLSLGRVGLSKS